MVPESNSRFPLVSVVIPTYNREGVLERAIESVLQQTYPNVEVLVIDDNSTDNTEEIVLSYSERGVEYIQLNENRGANVARNKGIHHATGEYVSFLDSDDEFDPAHIEKAIETILNSGKDVAGAYTSEKRIRDGEFLDINRASTRLSESADVLRDYPAGGFSGFTFCHEVFSHVGLLDESLDAFQDREFLVRFLQKFEMVPVSDVLVSCYFQRDGISANTDSRLSGLSQLIRKHQDKIGKKERANLEYTQGFLHARNGDMKSARYNFFTAVKKDPTKFRYIMQLLFSITGYSGFFFLNDIKNSIANIYRKWRG